MLRELTISWLMFMFSSRASQLFTRIADNQYLTGLCNVFIMLLPVSLISAFCMLVAHGLGLIGYQTLSEQLFSTSSLVWQLFPVLLIVFYSHFLASYHQLERVAIITPSMIIYFITSYHWELLKVGTVIPTNYPLAILVPIFVALTYDKIKGLQRLPIDEVPSVVDKSITMVASVCILVTVYSGLSYALRHYVFDDLHLSDYLPDLTLEYLSDGLIYEFVRNLFWSVGVNGHIILASYKTEIYHASIAAIEQHNTYGTPLPIMTSNFYDMYGGMGGSGNTISLVLAMLFFAKQATYRKLGFAVLILSIFNINEPVIYGLPVMFNPMLIIPFLATPIVGLLIAYASTSLGLVPPNIEVMSWMTPPVISGYIGTGNSWEGAVLQIVIILVGIAIYLPFFKKFESLSETKKIVSSKLGGYFFEEREVEISQPMASFIPHLSNNIEAQKQLKALQDTGEFILFYQPQYDISTGRVRNVEAVIRYRTYDGNITPPHFIDHFKSLGLLKELDFWVIERALDQVSSLTRYPHFKLSIDISPETLVVDQFLNRFLNMVDNSKLARNQLEVEITEDALIHDEEKTRIVLEGLREAGISVTLDDFGSGYSSLSYLSKYEFDRVKLDRSFTQGLSTPKGRKIFQLTSQLVLTSGSQIIADGIEKKQEVLFMKHLNISLLQGKFFYEPMPWEELVDRKLFSPIF